MSVNQARHESHAFTVDRGCGCLQPHAVAADASDLAVLNQHGAVFAGLHSVEQAHITNSKSMGSLGGSIRWEEAKKKSDQTSDRGFHTGSPGFLNHTLPERSGHRIIGSSGDRAIGAIRTHL